MTNFGFGLSFREALTFVVAQVERVVTSYRAVDRKRVRESAGSGGSMSDMSREMPASRSGGEASGTIAYYARAYRREGLAPGAPPGLV